MSMEATYLYEEMTKQGFTLTVQGSRLLVSPATRLTDPLRQRIRENKPALLRLVKPESPAPVAMKVYRVHVAMPKGDPRPPRWITMLAPGADLTEATRSAKARFGTERVLNVVESARARP